VFRPTHQEESWLINILFHSFKVKKMKVKWMGNPNFIHPSHEIKSQIKSFENNSTNSDTISSADMFLNEQHIAYNDETEIVNELDTDFADVSVDQDKL